MSALVEQLASGSPVAVDDMAAFLASLQEDEPDPGELSFVLGALVGRRSPADVVAFVQALRAAHPLRNLRDPERPTLNIVGTGGGPSTFNVSTATSFVLAAAGVRVVKTGSSAWKSRAGFLEVAAAMGCLRDLPWEQLEAILDEVGLVFVPPGHYAPVLARMAQICGRTAFRRRGTFINLTGPLLAPVDVDFRFYGASAAPWQEVLASALEGLGDVPAAVVRGHDGMDEVSPIAPSTIVRVGPSGRSEDRLDPRELDVPEIAVDEIAGESPMRARKLLESILGGEGTAAQSHTVALNAGVALHAVGAAGSIEEGAAHALELIRDGVPGRTLEALREAVRAAASR